MELQISILSKVRQKEKEILHDITHTTQTYLQSRNRHRDTKNRLVGAKVRGGRDGLGVWGKEMQTITQRMGGHSPTIKQRANHNGKEYKKNTQTCITKSPSCTTEINPILQINCM